MKKLYYYQERNDKEVFECEVIKETEKTYVVKMPYEKVVRKEIMSMGIGELFCRTYFYETKESAEKSHLSHLKHRIMVCEREAKDYLAKAEEYKKLVKDIYGDDCINN